MSENTIKKELHERLRAAREQAGLSQGQVARLMGLHRPTITEIEAGRRKVTAEEIAVFSSHYGVSADWLLHGSENSNPVVELAARELSKLKKEDLDRILHLLKTLKHEKS